MRAFGIRGADVEVLLDFLLRNYATALNRIWREGPRAHAVFVHNEFVKRTFTDQAVVVILDYDGDTDSCKTEVMSTAGGSGLFRDSWGSQEAAEDTFAREIQNLAHDHGWQFEEVTLRYSKKGVKCPSCGAVYSYSAEQVLEHGIVRCPNCGKLFLISEL